MYLRVTTPFDDPSIDRPYSMMSIARDHKNMKDRLVQRRQDPKYQYDKAFNLKYAPKVSRYMVVLYDSSSYDSALHKLFITYM